MKFKKELIVTIVLGIVMLLPGVFFLVGGVVQKTKLVYFGIIWIVVWGGLYTYRIIAVTKKLKRLNNAFAAMISDSNEEEQVKENLANYAFDHLMKEGKDYTVVARVAGAKLVKTVVRWATFMRIGQGIEAIFSIETDKVLACFQMRGTRLMRIKPEICTSIYPMLKP